MSYEFNPESQSLELPNPYRVENIALLASAAVFIICGLTALFLVRQPLMHAFDATVGIASLIAVSLLGMGIHLGVRALRQLRFFFGRNRPESLAPTLVADAEGDSPQAQQCKETLRHNALTFAEPKGPLNGLLYAWLPQLIYAPAVIQLSAQRQLHTFMSLLAILTSFLLCRMLVGSQPASDWIGVIYALTAYYFISPLRTNLTALGAQVPAEELDTGALVLMAVIAILGPVGFTRVSSYLPGLGGLAINAVLTFNLFVALGAVALALMALRMQLGAAPQEVGTARVLESFTLNAHPHKLVEELDRILMQEWFSQIPNRRYIQSLPRVHGQQGRFNAEILDETQPQPKPNCTAKDLRHAFSAPYFRWLAALSALAAGCLVAAAVTSLLVVHWLLEAQSFGSGLALAMSFTAVGTFAQQVAHTLWGRFDFVSNLIWVEMVGSYESARVNVGNQITGNVHTTKQVINIESMTMRVWVSEIESVIFGKDASRQLIRMRALPAKAEAIASCLKAFGESRSMIVAPTTELDASRAQKLGEINQAIGNTNASAHQIALPVASLLTKSGDSALTSDVALGVAQVVVKEAASEASSGSASGIATDGTTDIALTCGRCTSRLPLAAKFCAECGAPASTTDA